MIANLLSGRLAAGLLAVGAGAAHAADPLPSAGSSILQSLLGLALVLALIGAAAWLLRRLAGPLHGGSGPLRMVASNSLGPRERVVVVEFAGQWLVLGVTAQNVTPLHVMPRGELPPPGSAQPSGFAALLDRARNRHAPR
ncbi:MAG: flagellar biosynthetic protein FliO [Betaproteobacteria bacterium]|nr:flagellar biosynthetic protein FliO [Betaproteobacteria bacterium]